MIKHHPKFELIQAFVNGELPASLSAGVSIHASLCPMCQRTIAQLTEQIAQASFEGDELFSITSDLADAVSSIDRYNESSIDFDQMMNSITDDITLDVIAPKVEKTIHFKDNTYTLPTALNSIEVGKTAHIGKLSRARLQLDEGEIHCNLLHINPGGGVPAHTHKGFELTVLLDGSFSDEQGEYVKGDFIMLDSAHQHHPISEEGCLCYTVANDALHFTQGINKLLNPIGTFIY